VPAHASVTQPKIQSNNAAFQVTQPKITVTGGKATVTQPSVTLAKQAAFTVLVELGEGSAEGEVYTCDFSYDYVKINADYRS